MADTNQGQYYYGLGRRKEAIVTARLYRSGGGEIVVGEKTAQDYFNNPALTELLEQPIKLAGQEKKFRVSLNIKGGGKRGQADAARLAITRALEVMDESLRPSLKKAGYLTRDPREKERKKPGLKRARKAPQFSKR